MKALAPLALLALAALSPAPINDAAHAPAPVPERSQATLTKEMAYAGAYQPVGAVPRRTQEGGKPLRDAPARRDGGSVSAASNEIVRDDGSAIVRATARVEGRDAGWRPPVWLLLGLALGGAFGIVRGLKAWADRNLPSLGH